MQCQPFVVVLVNVVAIAAVATALAAKDVSGGRINEALLECSLQCNACKQHNGATSAAANLHAHI